MEEPIELIEWSDVQDPTYEFEFMIDWDFINKAYRPNDIQKLIDEYGVRDMIREVNEYMFDTFGRRALYISHYKGRKTLINK